MMEGRALSGVSYYLVEKYNCLFKDNVCLCILLECNEIGQDCSLRSKAGWGGGGGGGRTKAMELKGTSTVKIPPCQQHQPVRSLAI